MCDVQLALIVCGSATPWSQCPLERSGWTHNVSVFRQWLDAFQPLGGGLVPQPLVAGKCALQVSFQLRLCSLGSCASCVTFLNAAWEVTGDLLPQRLWLMRCTCCNARRSAIGCCIPRWHRSQPRTGWCCVWSLSLRASLCPGRTQQTVGLLQARPVTQSSAR